jgi:hypothetical protein
MVALRANQAKGLTHQTIREAIGRFRPERAQLSVVML